MELLKQLHKEAKSKYWLVRIASIQGETLLSRWIREVLHRLNKSWERIRCARCDNAQGLRIKPERITSAGAVTGSIHCTCGERTDNAALITHCWNPSCALTKPLLVIGTNEMCTKCGGLRCDCGNCRCRAYLRRVGGGFVLDNEQVPASS